jgi:hypothetical protein
MDPTDSDLRIVTRRPSLSVHAISVQAGTMRLRAMSSDEGLVVQIASHHMLRNVDSDEHKHNPTGSRRATGSVRAALPSKLAAHGTCQAKSCPVRHVPSRRSDHAGYGRIKRTVQVIMIMTSRVRCTVLLSHSVFSFLP